MDMAEQAKAKRNSKQDTNKKNTKWNQRDQTKQTKQPTKTKANKHVCSICIHSDQLHTGILELLVDGRGITQEASAKLHRSEACVSIHVHGHRHL